MHVSSRLPRSDASCVRRCANGCDVNSPRVGSPPETRSPSHAPMLFSTLHQRVFGNRLQILPMYTDGRRRPTCEWHRGCDDSAMLQMSQPTRVVLAACDDPLPSAMPGPSSSWQSLAPPCLHSRSAQVRAPSTQEVERLAQEVSWQSLVHLRVLENAEHASPSCAGASPTAAACNHARSADSNARTGAMTY